MIWGVLTFLTVAGAIQAQLPSGPPGALSVPGAPGVGSQGNYPAEMTIVQPEVEVRGGPTKQHYATSKLHQGERVIVIKQSKEQPGWLAIKPPPGSFSWIKGKNVKQFDDHYGVVLGESNATVPVMPGSSIVQQTPNVESVQVPAGSQVVILDKPFNHEGEVWLPIQPPPTEVRFIPAEAVSPPPVARAVTPAGGFPTTVGGDNNLISQADQAYRIGNIEIARQLYRQAADKATDPTQRAYALNRLATMQQPASGGPAWQPGYTPQNGQLTNQTSKYAGAQPTTAPMTMTQPAQWSGWGWLRRASFDKDGHPAYVLESRQGQPPIYVTTDPGMTLQDYVGKWICLYGPIVFHSEDNPRVPFMVASRVALP